MSNKILFIDRDGTLIHEPADEQVDCLSKLKIMTGVIPALLALQVAGYQFVILTNQDGLGTASFPEQQFWPAQRMFLHYFNSQGIVFKDVHICPHLAKDHCDCRKPKLGLVHAYLRERSFIPEHSYVIGDRDSDMQLAEAMGITGLHFASKAYPNWHHLSNSLLQQARRATVVRKTKETQMTVTVNLDENSDAAIKTGIGFFDHMLEQIAAHAGITLQLQVQGDLHVDPHHTVEDTALALGEAIKRALGDKLGIQRYGFVLPMDEALAQVAIDLSGRPYAVFEGRLTCENIGHLPTELIPHFFQSLAQSLSAAIHVTVTGDNNHHMVEACFKALGRALRQAIYLEGHEMPSTKGVL